MKSLLFSDLHVSYLHLNNLKKILQSEKIDLIISSGDILNMGEPTGFMSALYRTVGESGVPLFWVPGNNDFGRGYHLLNSKIKSLEGRIVEFGGRNFCGVGGSPASWSGQYSGEKMISEEKIIGSIFVSHVPPPGILNYRKDNSASPTNKKFSNSPAVHICGHIHTQCGCAYLGQTKVIKLAPLLYGHYAIMDLDNLEVEFKHF